MRMFLGTVGAMFFISKKPLASAWPTGQADSSPIWGYLARFFHDAEQVAVIGQKHLECTPCDADEKTLLSLVVPDVAEPDNQAGATAYARFATAIQEKIRDDFSVGRVVNLEGWILSETEVRLCSLVALRTAAGGSLV